MRKVANFHILFLIVVLSSVSGETGVVLSYWVGQFHKAYITPIKLGRHTCKPSTLEAREDVSGVDGTVPYYSISSAQEMIL